MAASLQPEIHTGTDFPGHPELSQLNEIAAASEFQGCLQNQSQVWTSHESPGFLLFMAHISAEKPSCWMLISMSSLYIWV